MTNDELSAHLEASEGVADVSGAVAKLVSGAALAAKTLGIPIPEALSLVAGSTAFAAGSASTHYSARAKAYIQEIARRKLRDQQRSK